MPSVRQPANKQVIRYLERETKRSEDIRPPSPEHDYWGSGSHPEVVERIWDELGKNLPADSKRVVCGTPALVHPRSMVLIAVAIGTEYAIRLSTARLRSGVPSTVRTETVWAGGDRLNVRAEFGSAWILGSYSSEEETWCRESFEEHG